MASAGYRNVDGELLLGAAIVHECGHARYVDIGPIRYLETYRKDKLGASEPCGRCPGFPYRTVTAVELWDSGKASLTSQFYHDPCGSS